MFIPMWVIVWVVVGGLAGLLASLIIRGTGLGLLGDILIGIAGAILGGFLFEQFGHPGVTEHGPDGPGLEPGDAWPCRCHIRRAD